MKKYRKWERDKKFRKHAKELPCFNCIIRVPCGNLGECSVQDPCDKFFVWQRKRNLLVGRSLLEWNDIMNNVEKENK